MLQAEIKEQIVLLLQEKVSPDFIVLFGSFAKGTNHEKSDVDLAYFSKKGSFHLMNGFYWQTN